MDRSGLARRRPTGDLPLPVATPEEISEQVRENIKAFMPGGGFVFNNVHNIQSGIPPENIVAMYDTVYEYGRYE